MRMRMYFHWFSLLGFISFMSMTVSANFSNHVDSSQNPKPITPPRLPNVWFDILTPLLTKVQPSLQIIESPPGIVDGYSTTWNSLLRADGTFPKEFDLISTDTRRESLRRRDSVELSNKLKFILKNHFILNKFYSNYKTRFHKEISRKSLPPQERMRRVHIFLQNILKIAQHNMEYEAGRHTWWMGLNQFTDNREKGALRLPFEYEAMTRLGHAGPVENKIEKTNIDWMTRTEAPLSVDWRLRNVVNFSAKDQGDCGSCYSFASIGLLESTLILRTGQSIRLSEQEVVDCSKVTGNAGCGGGSYESTLTYLTTRGVALEKDYGYTSNVTRKSGRCQSYERSVRSGRVFGIKPKYFDIEGKEEILRKAVWHIGPIAVDSVLGLNWFLYDGGVFDDFSNDNDYAHTFVIVGYGRENKGQDRKRDYWLVKSSWGSSWGETGYMKVIRGSRLLKLWEERQDVFSKGFYFSGANFVPT